MCWRLAFSGKCQGGTALVELVLWVVGVETQIEKEDPLRGFSNLVTVFHREGDVYRTRAAAGEKSVGLLESMLDTAADMEANGERHTAFVERCHALDQAVAIGDEQMMHDLADMVRSNAETGPLWLQIQAWTSLANLRMATGNMCA